MSDNAKLAPTAITLHKKSRLLELGFSDGFSFSYPCEYLRVFSPSAEVKTAEKPEYGKADVNISDIEMQGTYALLLKFDDGHDTGIYSWGTLHQLGKNYEKNWQSYLQKLEKFGLERGNLDGEQPLSIKNVRIVYFMEASDLAGKDEESTILPMTVSNVETFTYWLAKRDKKWHEALEAGRIRIMVNKQFGEPDTSIKNGDEIGVVPIDPSRKQDD